jgi:hypothetical protein
VISRSGLRVADQRASARIAVATIASASAGVNPPCPVALRYIAGGALDLGSLFQFSYPSLVQR